MQLYILLHCCYHTVAVTLLLSLLTCSHVGDYHIIEYLSHQPVVSMETHCSHLLHCNVLVWKERK